MVKYRFQFQIFVSIGRLFNLLMFFSGLMVWLKIITDCQHTHTLDCVTGTNSFTTFGRETNEWWRIHYFFLELIWNQHTKHPTRRTKPKQMYRAGANCQLQFVREKNGKVQLFFVPFQNGIWLIGPWFFSQVTHAHTRPLHIPVVWYFLYLLFRLWLECFHM